MYKSGGIFKYESNPINNPKLRMQVIERKAKSLEKKHQRYQLELFEFKYHCEDFKCQMNSVYRGVKSDLTEKAGNYEEIIKNKFKKQKRINLEMEHEIKEISLDNRRMKDILEDIKKRLKSINDILG